MQNFELDFYCTLWYVLKGCSQIKQYIVAYILN